MVTIAEIITYLYPSASLLTDVSLIDNGFGPYVAAWNASKLGPQPTQAQLDAAIPAAEAAKAKQDIQDQIALLEASITPRMLRETLLGKTDVNPKTGKTAKQQIQDIDSQITALRATL